jgi:hypothetical protein
VRIVGWSSRALAVSCGVAPTRAAAALRDTIITTADALAGSGGFVSRAD